MSSCNKCGTQTFGPRCSVCLGEQPKKPVEKGQLVCLICGSSNVQHVEWIWSNKNTVVESGEPFIDKWSNASAMGMTYCPACSEAGRNPNPELTWLQ